MAQEYLAKVGLSSSQEYSEHITKLVKDCFIGKLFDKARPVQKVRVIFDMLSQISNESRTEIQQMLVGLLQNRLCENLLVTYQTPEYIRLRSKLGLNHFPFDDVLAGGEETQSTGNSGDAL